MHVEAVLLTGTSSLVHKTPLFFTYHCTTGIANIKLKVDRSGFVSQTPLLPKGNRLACPVRVHDLVLLCSTKDDTRKHEAIGDGILENFCEHFLP